MSSSRKSLTVDYKQLHSSLCRFIYDTATHSKHKGRFYDVERITTQWKCGSGSLVLFLIRHVLSLESAFSSRKLMFSVYWMMHTCIIRTNSIASHTKRYHCALVFVSIVQGRLFSYHDTHLHRLGTNYLQLPVNCPYKTRVCNNQRDGPQTFDNQSKLSQTFDCDSFWTRN